MSERRRPILSCYLKGFGGNLTTVRSATLGQLSAASIKSRSQWERAITLVAGAALLIVGCAPVKQSAYSPAAKGPSRAPPAGALAAPKSLRQVGLPVKAVLAAVAADKPHASAKIALGEMLFFDGRLSADGTRACSSCHNPARAFTDGRPLAVGIKGRVGQRNSPTIMNALFNKTQFWDGRARTLEDQAQLPIVNPTEMGQPNLGAAVTAIAADRAYQQAFQSAFGRPPNGLDLLRAIAAYERTQLSFNAPFDHFIAGDRTAISHAAKRGWDLFNTKARCSLCHARPATKPDTTHFTDNDFHNIGVSLIRNNVDALACRAQTQLNFGNMISVDRAAIQTSMSALGRFLVTNRTADIAAFKTPNLRNVLITAPYFHDGSQATLRDVVDHYNKGGRLDPWLDTNIHPLALSEAEIDDIVAFLATLTSAQFREVGAAELARQRKISGTSRPQRDVARAFAPKPILPKPALVCGRPR